MKPRPYQIECLQNIASAWYSGVSKQAVIIPTGGGKTFIFSNLPKTLGLKRGQEQMLILVHRDELVYQTVDQLTACNPDLLIDIEKAKKVASPYADIVVASVQSIGRMVSKDEKELALDSLWGVDDGLTRWPDRLTKFDASRFRYVVIDEVHHAVAGESYHNVLRFFDCFKPDKNFDSKDKLLLGVTATPNRADNLGLERILGSIVFSRDIRTMVSDGWLCDIKGYRVDTEADISEVKTTAGDLNNGQLGSVVNTPERNGLVVKKYLELGEGMPAFGFTVNIQHSIDLAEKFNEAGVRAFALSERTPKDARKWIVDSFRAGEISVLTSCGIVNEGFDAPRGSVALMCRPTKSGLLYQQQIGRSVRPFPAPEDRPGWTGWVKPYAIVVDFVDVCGRHQLNTIPTLFGLPSQFNFNGEKALSVLEEIDELGEKMAGVDLAKAKTPQALRAMVSTLDLLATPTIPDEVKRYSRYSWLKTPSSAYILSLPDSKSIMILENALGAFDIFQSMNGFRKLTTSAPSIDLAFLRADAMVPADAIGVVSLSASWRYDKPSEKQAKMLGRLRPDIRRRYDSFDDYYVAVCKLYNKGDVSRLIDSLTRR